MKTLFYFLFLLFAVLLADSCSNTAPSPYVVKKKHNFIFSQKEMQGSSTIYRVAFQGGFIVCLLENNKVMVFDTSLQYSESVTRQLNKDPISQVVFHKRFIICLLENRRIVVFDSALRQVDSMSKHLNGKAIRHIIQQDDTIFAINKRRAWYLGSDMSLKPYFGNTVGSFFKMQYSDSAYDVYSCCMGEFGGVVYFRQKQSGKVFAYPATCVEQVLRFGGRYIVCSELSHLAGSSGFISIRDPSTLLSNDDFDGHICGWRGSLRDSMNDYKYLRHLKRPGTTEYFDGTYVCLLATFSYGGELYSIYNKGSEFTPRKYLLLGRHQNYDVIAEDTLRSSTEWIDCPRVVNSNGMVVTVFESGKWVGEGDSARHFRQSELLLVKRDSIKILRIGLPALTHLEEMKMYSR